MREMLLSEEQESLAAAVRDWLADRTDLAAARGERAGQAVLYTAGDLAAAAELGLPGLLRPDEEGTYADLAVVVEELGRAASPLPLGEAAVAARVLDETGIGAEVAGQVAAGEALCVPVVAEPGEEPLRAMVAERGALLLTGRASAVVGGLGAAWLLVTAAVGDGERAVALVAADQPEVSVRARTSLDLTRDIAVVELGGVPVARGRWAALTEKAAVAVDAARTMLVAVDAVGAAGRLLDMTVGYVGERSQFGRVVGSFQAVKHACATMALEVEAARVCGRDVARALDAGDSAEAAATAGAIVGEGCSRAASTALQMHGGMGFTWEHDLHLYLRRVKVDELLAGTPRQHRERLLSLAG
jgi:alkylation response protein AidB-like acyl-CoA dehydrogenase